MNGERLPDPLRGPSGILYWVIPHEVQKAGGLLRSSISYDLNHSGPLGTLPAPALLANFHGDRSELLKGKLDSQDFKAARAITVNDDLSENEGAIKLPLNNAQVRIRDRISIVVEEPSGQPQTLMVNGAIVDTDRIGETTVDGPRGVTRSTYVGVPIQVGPNDIQVGNEKITIYRVGVTNTIEVTPQTTIADGSTAVRIKFRTLDAFGKLSSQSRVTVHSSLEPLTADASTGEAGFQVGLIDGEGVLELQAQSSPTILKLDVLNGDEIKTYHFDIRPDRSEVGIGTISATVGLDGSFSPDDLTWQARASYEGPVAGGKLYLSADKDGLPSENDTLKRFTIEGDASTETVPLQGIDPVAITYDHPLARVDYRHTTMPIDVLAVGENLTALTVRSKTTPEVSGFIAAVPEDRINVELTPSGTRLIKLPNSDISAGSDTFQVVTLEPYTNKELKRVTLVRNVDYILDYRTGVVTLTHTLETTDSNLNQQVFQADYRLSDSKTNRQLAYGAQVKTGNDKYMIGAAVISLDNQVTFGARASYKEGETRLDGLLAYSDGLQLSAEIWQQIRQ